LKGKVREVATAVPYNPEKQQFLLLERTPDADIHPRKMELSRGHIEDEEPEKASLRELREETKLSGEILKTGESFKLETEDGLFRVYPFLVLVRDEPELNEEHIEKEWIEPSELEQFDTVDGLKTDLKKLDVEF